MRRNSQPNEAAAARASMVLPIPGTSSRSTWPSASSATSTNSATAGGCRQSPGSRWPGRPKLCAPPAPLDRSHGDRRAPSSTPRRHAPAHPWPLPIAPPFDPFLKSIRRNSAQTSRKDRTSSPHGTLEPYLTSTHARSASQAPVPLPDTPRSARQRIQTAFRLTASIPVRRRPRQQLPVHVPHRSCIGIPAEAPTPKHRHQPLGPSPPACQPPSKVRSKRTTQAFHIRCAPVRVRDIRAHATTRTVSTYTTTTARTTANTV